MTEVFARKISRRPIAWPIGWAVVQAIVVFIATFGLLLAPNLFGFTFFDEGLIATGAMEVLHGRIPYRDFFSPYGPAQYYLTAALFAGFGQKLVVLRIAECALLAAIAVSVFELAKVSNKGRASLAEIVVCVYAGFVLFAKLFAGYPAIPATLLLLLSALAFGKWSVNQRAGVLVFVSVLIGLVGVWRWDFGVFGLIALALSASVAGLRGPAPPKTWLAVGAQAMLPAVAIAVAVYVPFLVIFSDPARWFREVVVFLFSEFPRWRSNELIRPMVWQFASSWRRGQAVEVADVVVLLAFAALPGALVIATLGVVARRFLAHRKEWFDQATAQSIFLCLMALFLLNQMRVRPDVHHLSPALTISLPLIPYLVREVSLSDPIRIPLLAIRNIAVFVLGALILQFAFKNWMLSIDRRAMALDTPRASGIRVKPGLRYYAELVNDVRSRTAEGESIYSGALDHSTLWANDPMLYFLSGRLPADRFVDLEPGLANTRKGQQEIIGSLESNAVRIVVLLDLKSEEPNLSATSNRIHDLDLYIAKRYRRVAQFGPYTVLEAR